MSTVLLGLPPAQCGVIPSKITIPALPATHLPRPALARRIQDAIARRLTLVVAPAGHGKSTAVAEAVRRSPTTAAWVTFDLRDREPARAWHHLVAAIDAVTGLPSDASAPLSGADALEAAIRRLHDHGEHVVLVLDDSAGVIVEDDAALLDAALDWMPPQVSVVLVTRKRPSFSVGRRRSSTELDEIGADDLRMTDDEVERYLNDVCGLGLDPVAIGAVTRDTEGWPSLVSLVADQVRATRATPTPALLPSDDDVLDVVLAALSPEEADVLAQLVALDRITGPRCRAATGRPDGGDLVESLARQGVLLPDTHGTGMLRPHPFVRAAFRRRLDATRVDWREAGTRAARWLASQGEWGDAVRGALEVGDVDQAVAWIDAELETLVAQDGGRLLREALSVVPPDLVASRPALLAMALDASLLAGDREGIERLLDVLACRRDDPTSRLADRAEQYLARLRGDHVATDDAVGEMTPLRELASLSDLAWKRAVAGRLGDADLLVRRAARGSRRWGLERLPARAQLARAQIALDRKRWDIALSTALDVRAWSGRTHDVVVWVEAGLLAGRCHGAHGDLGAAAAILDEIHARLAEVPHGGAVALRVARAEASLRLAAGEVESLSFVLPELFGHTELEDLSPEDRLLLTRVHLRRGEAARALALAATLEGSGVGPRVEAEAARVMAVAARGLGDVTTSRRARARAAEIARAEGLAEVPMVHHPRDWPDDGPRHHGPPGGVVVEEPHSTPMGPPLTDREQQVLRQLPSRLSNIEIAAALYVSENTVKSHLKSIYRKLGVRTRRDAISRARTLGLLTGAA